MTNLLLLTIQSGLLLSSFAKQETNHLSAGSPFGLELVIANKLQLQNKKETTALRKTIKEQKATLIR